MNSVLHFLNSIGHSEKVYIRCIPPKNTPVTELQARGMTYQAKDGGINRSVIKGHLNLTSGEFSQKLGDNFKSITNGWGYLESLNQQGYGVFFVVSHGGDKNSQITHGTTLFHESDRASLDQQQQTIDRISQEFGKPTSVVKTRKSLHAYWASSEPIPIVSLGNYQRQWCQYSGCDDNSLSDPAQLMRLPCFDHVSWNPETNDFDRIRCELLQLNDVKYSLGDFDTILPELDLERWSKKSIKELEESDISSSDVRAFVTYLDGYCENGRDGWITAKCPAHDGESNDSLHVNRATGGFICHAGCSTSSVYAAAKTKAFAKGYRLEVLPHNPELARDVENSLNLKNGTSPNLFSDELGGLLNIAAANFNIPAAILYFCLLPILGSRIDSRTNLLINPGTDYRVPPIRWCGLVGETGTKKSPILSLLTKPINRQQNELYESYRVNKLEFEKEYRNWKKQKPGERGEEPEPPPPLKDLYFSDFTIESIASSLSNYPNGGYLVMVDEMAQFFNSMDAYRGGKGADRQQWLTGWNGYGLKINRKSSDTIVVPQSNISILGGIQPQTIANLLSADRSDQDGLWNRFSFMAIPDRLPDPFSEIPIDLGDVLDRVYRDLSFQQPNTHLLSFGAKEVWREWYTLINHQRMAENNWLIKGTLAKFEAIAARNALILHRTLAAIEGVTPAQMISAETLKLAVEWTQFELNQTLSQYQLLSIDDSDPELVKILKFIDKFKGKGWVSARDVSRWWTTKPIPSAVEIRAFMGKVVSMNYAINNGEAIDSTKYRIQILEKSTDNTDKNGERHNQQGFNHVGSSTDSGTDNTDRSTDNSENGEAIDSTKYRIQILEKSTDNTDKNGERHNQQGFNHVGSSTDRSTDNTDRSTDNSENGEAIDSTKYRIQILEKSTDNTDKNRERHNQQGFNHVGSSTDNTDRSTDKNVGSSTDKTDSGTDKNVGSSTDSVKPLYTDGFKDFVSIVSIDDDNVGSSTDNSEMAVNGHSEDDNVGFVGSSTDSVKPLYTNGFKDFVSIVSIDDDNVGSSTDNSEMAVNGQSEDDNVGFVGSSTDNSEMAVNGHSEDDNVGFVGSSTDSVKPLYTNGFKDFVSIVSTFSENKNSNPRDAIKIVDGRIDVNLDLLDLNYQPSKPIPHWEPTKTIKPYEKLSKLYLDIETNGLDSSTNRVLMVGMMNERGEKIIISDPDERVILTRTMDYLAQNKPECLIGHNLFEFDLKFLANRCNQMKIKQPFTRGHKPTRITSSSVNGQPIEFTPIYWTGVNILDTYQQIAIWDKAATKLTGYGLKDSTIALGLRDDRRLELSVSEIRECWENEYKSTIEEYLGYDLDDTRLLADFLLPVVYYQMVYVPNLSFQQMAIASPALKAQKIHQEFSSGLYPDPIADKRLKYEGGRVELVTPGLHQNVGKIDVSSLYPSVMLRYGICSRKDTDNEFLGVLEFMRSERLRLKDLAKSGDKSASFQEKALKVLINGSYGFLGTGGYSFNDFEAAALVTAYGRKILSLMVDVVSSCGGIVIEIDTDGILFSHNEPKTVSRLVAESLPDGIDIELELSDCGLYAPKAKNYVIIHPNGETAVKGLYRKRDRYPLEKEFPIQFLKTYFTRSPELADKYYHQTRQRLIDRVVDVCELTVTKKIPASDKKLTALNLGKHGDRVSYWMTKHEVHHKKTGKLMRYEPRETTRESYWAEYYIDKLDEQYREILGINQVKPEKKSADRQLEP